MKHETVLREKGEKAAEMLVKHERRSCARRTTPPDQRRTIGASEAANQKSKAAMFRVLTGAEHHGAVEKTKKMYACNELTRWTRIDDR